MAEERAWTVREILAWTVEHFRKAGVPSPRLNAELLLAQALKLPARLELLLEPERKLAGAERAAFREFVKRRAAREPAAHILGSWGFYGRNFEVTGDVLTPRSETELVAEKAVSWAKAGGAKRALDLGTGSGCLAVTLALEVPELRVVATDISEPALAVARKNAERLKAAERIEFRCGDLFAALTPHPSPQGRGAGGEGAFDLIVSNPPYIPTGEMGKLMPEIAKWEPRLALDGGADGLDFYRRLAAALTPYPSPNGRGAGGEGHLRPGGAVVLEIGDGQGPAVKALFESAGGYQDIEVSKDLAGQERIFLAVRK